MINKVRLAKRSTITPPTRPNSSTGRNCSATATPTAATLPLISSTSQSWAIRCIHKPVVAITCDESHNR